MHKPEDFWKGAVPGLSFEVDPKVPTVDRVKFNQEVKNYIASLKRWMMLEGLGDASLGSD